MAPVSLKIVLDNGAVTRKVKFNITDTVKRAHQIVKDKVLNADDTKEYGLYLRCAEDDISGVWLDNHKTLEYYMLRNGDSLDYICKIRNLRVRLLDGSVKTLQVDQSKSIADLMKSICSRIGIINWDEYGLCREEDQSEDAKDAKTGQTATGTLTTKRKIQQKRDDQLEQLSKKLHTDDNVHWLDQHKTLFEEAVDVTETLLLKRRLYYSDRNVDSRDPVQLNLLYVQTRDAILNGTHLITEAQAEEFAGIQCQIQYGDFQEEKHKPGFIENFREFLPEQYCGGWGVEKKIFKEHKKHRGLSQIDAKYLYTKTARDLPTYGVTFFVVKEQQKGKKKLVPRLLGINAQSILRLDETTKEILQAWPLTHVKTYHTGKSETFTLNFGDYSDKEYTVKTHDAQSIKDILEGYIDIIQKRKLAKHNVDTSEAMVICQDNVAGGRGNIIQNVVHQPNKVIEQTFVGPNRILPFEKGDQISQGTQIVTVQQMIVPQQTNKAQNAIKGEIPTRSDMSMQCVKSLNHLNTNSVQIVTFLTDPDDTSLRDARRTLKHMQADLPIVIDGVKKAAEKQTSEDAKKKLLDELEELEEYMKILSKSMDPDNFDCVAADDAAKKIADITTQMYFSLDPRTRRRSDMLRRSRKSFIADERTDATLRRASFLAAANTALHLVENASKTLQQEYLGPPLSQDDVEELQNTAKSNLAALNAALALYLQAHADPDCIDYSAALASMNSIQEVMPDLAKNTLALGSVKSDEERKKFQAEMQELLDNARKMCDITGVGDHEKMQEVSVKYADAAARLIFTFGRGSNDAKLEEIINLAKEAGSKTSLLLVAANELTCQAPDEPAAKEVDDMGVKAANCARDLLACAQLSAPALQEPHCRSALTASAVALSSAAQQLAAAWKPLVEEPSRHHHAALLHQRTMDLAHALDRLRDAYDDLDDKVFSENLSPCDQQRLKFVASASAAIKNLKLAEDELNRPLGIVPKNGDLENIRKDLEKKIAQMNAAIASLVAATADRSNPDYVTAELAVNTVSELLPDVIKASKAVASSKEGAECATILDHLRLLCDASNKISANSGQLGGEDMREAVTKFANASGRLTYIIYPHINPNKGDKILDLSTAACVTASELLSDVQKLSESFGGEIGDELENRRIKLADAAQALLTNAKVTASSMSDRRCEGALLSSVEALSACGRALSEEWAALPPTPRTKHLDAQLQRLHALLDDLRAACAGTPPHSTDADIGMSTTQEQRRLKFINSLSGMKGNLKTAQDELTMPFAYDEVKNEDPVALERRLSEKLALLNAAIAALVSANTDCENFDYLMAEQAVTTISKLMPEIVKETKLASASKSDKERAAMLDHIRALCEASHKICASAGQDQGLNDSAAEFADAARKLVFVKSPFMNLKKEDEVLNLAAVACGKTTHLLANVQQLAKEVDEYMANELDRDGVQTSDAAQTLLINAQITAPFISEPNNQSTLVSSINALSSSSRNLGNLWRKIKDHHHEGLKRNLEKDLTELEAALEDLSKVCKDQSSDAHDGVVALTKEQQRLKFVNTISKAKNKLKEAEEDINKPFPSDQVKEKDIGTSERRFSEKMAQLNAAIAALVVASSDRQNPDFPKAEEAITTISKLMPEVVKETKLLSASKSDKERAAMMNHIHALCEASNKIYENAGQDQGLNDSAVEFADVAGKLVFIKRPLVDPKKEEQLLDLSALVCGKTTHLLANVQQLAQAVGGDVADELDKRGTNTVDAAQALLTNAQLTAPCISEPGCQRAMIASIEALSASNHKLEACWSKIKEKPHLALQKTLEMDLKDLNITLDQLRKACQVNDNGLENVVSPLSTEQQRLKFINNKKGLENSFKTAQEELKKPLQSSEVKTTDVRDAEQRLSQKIAELNAAIAALITATSDPENSSYVKAESAVQTISNLIPEIAKDSKVASANKSDRDRTALLEDVRKLCEASQKICANAAQDQGPLNESAAKFADASRKLVFVVSQSPDLTEEKEVIDLSTLACEKTANMLANVKQLSKDIGGEMGQELDKQRSKTADAAQGLLNTGLITAPTILERKCQKTLKSSIDCLSTSNQNLQHTWRKIKDQHTQALQNVLDKDSKDLHAILDQLNQVCSGHDLSDTNSNRVNKSKPAPPARTSASVKSISDTQGPMGRTVPPSIPSTKPQILAAKPKLSGVQIPKNKIIDITQQFLDRIRFEESHHRTRPRSTSQVSQPSADILKTDDEKRMHQLFMKNIGEGQEMIKKSEDALRKVHEAKTNLVSSPLNSRELLNKRQTMQEKLAKAGVEVAALVNANYDNKIDFYAASKSAQALPDLISSFVEEGTIVSSTMKDEARKAFLADMLGLCESTKTMLDAAKTDRQKLNNAAIMFVDNTTKLLTVASLDRDPLLEKEIISRTKEIGDCASRIALEAVNVAEKSALVTSNEINISNICEGGTMCVDAAGKLVYTAKLVSPSIHDTTCQEALISSANNLSSHLKSFSNTWNPFSPDPIVAKSAQTLAKETAKLENLLEGLRRDVKGGAIGKRRELQQLVIEDTPLRMMTMKTIDDAKYMAECPDIPFGKRSDYAAYADRLAIALRELDIANAKCKKSPQDTTKRRDLENAIVNLQMILLQTRPRKDDKINNNIVDIRDYIDDVLKEVDTLKMATKECYTESNRSKKAIEDLKGICEKINDAYKLTITNQDKLESSFDDILQVDNFGQECELRIKSINTVIQTIEDEKAKNMLQKKILPLIESCNLLRFATRSGISTAQSASLDETLDDLDDLENRVIKSFVDDTAKVANVQKRHEFPPIPPAPWIKSQLCSAVVDASQRAKAQPLPSAFAAYIADVVTRTDLQDPAEKDNLLKHLYKVVHQLKELTVTTSNRLATWQPLQHPEVSKITEQILQELDNPEYKFGVKNSKPKSELLSGIDVNKLLMPCENVKIDGDAKQLKDKVQQLCSKLSTTSIGVVQSAAKMETLSRSLRATVECAHHLKVHAHALQKKQDALQANKIQEATQEMSFATYNLLKTCEHGSQNPEHPETKRKLLDALRQLNDSINKLGRAICPVGKAGRAGAQAEEQSRLLQLQAAALLGGPRALCALPYPHCLDAINSQNEIIQKLKNDQHMSREELIKNMNYVSSAVCNSTDYAVQCAYLLSASEKDEEISKTGVVDVQKLQKLTSSIQDTCLVIIRSSSVEFVEGDKEKLEKLVGDLIQNINESTDKIKNPILKSSLERCNKDLNATAIDVSRAFNNNLDKNELTSATMELLAAVHRTNAVIEDTSLIPPVTTVSAERQAWCDDVMNSSRTLISKTQALVKEVKSTPESEDPNFTMTWYSFNTNRNHLLNAFDALLKSVHTNGQRAGILEGSPEELMEAEVPPKSYLQLQLESAKRWLETPMCKANTKTQGELAVHDIIGIAEKMCGDMKTGDGDDMDHLIAETKQLLNDCKKKYNNEKYSVLLDRVKELKKGVERGVVTRVVEEFIHGDEPLADLEIIADAEKDETKRKFLLEKKIAELLSQLGRITKTARFITDASNGTHNVSKDLKQQTEQTELLAPMLVKAAQERITHPDNKVIIEKYRTLLAQYAESLSKVRDLCDQAVDPMDFVQTAGDAMQRMREESALHNDPVKGAQTSQNITKLANRVINVSMSSRLAQSDPELRRALAEVRARLHSAAAPPAARASRLPDWRDTTAEILRTTGEVESVLGGENIFRKQPEPDQPIYSVALDLHTSIKDWSSRDNEIVAAARRTAVLMAKLSDYMNMDRKRELLATSKSIVTESHEVAYLAKKLAQECTDVRIKTNLLKACERIPTISSQLKMLTTVKGSAMGRQGSEEDKEAMNMLIHNAESLMLSIQEVVKAAASASVKIMSQRGTRIKWVRKNYY